MFSYEFLILFPAQIYPRYSVESYSFLSHRYLLGSEDNFKIDSITGVLRTNAIFTERAGEVTSIDVTASDQDVASRSSAQNFVVSIIDNNYLLLIVVDDTVTKTLLCLDQLVAKLVEITSFQVILSADLYSTA